MHAPSDAEAGVDIHALARKGAVHFMGIGGAGMSPLAELLARTGGQVSGCDVRTGATTRALESLGVRVHEGHAAEHVEGAVAVVRSAAIPSDHPEVRAAREKGIPVLKRAAALGALVNPATLVGVAGTHGKTSTTGMTVEVLAAADLDPTGIVGGRVASWTGNLRMGGSDLYVVEADEYDRSFLTLQPDVAVVTNLEADHLDTYGDLAGVETAFIDFVDRVPVGGRAAICADDHGASRLLVDLGSRGYTYGLQAGAQLRATDLAFSPAESRFKVVEEGRRVGSMVLSLPGLHNVRNALAASAVARHLGASWEAIRDGLAEYRGVARRFERLGEHRGVAVIDDYAHHPTEIHATLEAVSKAFPGRRAVAVFQPHLFTRTRDFATGFGEALAEADVVWVTDIYPAREAPIPGIDGTTVVKAARAAGAREIHYHAQVDGLAQAVAERLRPGDVCVTMGAGSIDSVATELARVLEAIRA